MQRRRKRSSKRERESVFCVREGKKYGWHTYHPALSTHSHGRGCSSAENSSAVGLPHHHYPLTSGCALLTQETPRQTWHIIRSYTSTQVTDVLLGKRSTPCGQSSVHVRSDVSPSMTSIVHVS